VFLIDRKLGPIMSIHTLDLARWNRVSMELGGILWVLIVLVWVPGLLALNALEVLLLLAFWVITPLALALVSRPAEYQLLHALYRLVLLLHPAAALIAGVSLLIPTGLLAAGAAAAWFLFTALIALVGVFRLFQKGKFALTDACLASALIYLPVGGAWFVLARWGLRPLGFSQTTVLLTAVHFHFITLAALIMTGLTGQALRTIQSSRVQQIYQIAAIGMLVNPLLVAAGITLTQVTGARFLESASAVLLALSLMGIALLGLRFIVPATDLPLAKVLFILSGASVLFAMLFAAAYAVGAATGVWTITISQMIVVHGWVNALGFGFFGLLGWRLTLKRD
jgi:hypothetical protein